MSNTKKSKKIFASIFALVGLGLVVVGVQAEEGVVLAKLSLGVANYVSPSAKADIVATYPTLGLGLTYVWPSNIFADVTLKTTGSSATYNAASVTPLTVTSDQRFSRNEHILTVGMPLDNGMQGNAGIFTADTVFKLAQFGQFSQTVMGLTAGVGKGVLIEGDKLGSVAVNGAFALLKATSTDTNGSSKYSNLSYGLSFGGAYSYPINKYLRVSADGKFQSFFIRYSNFSGDERILSLTGSLIGRF